MIEHKLKDVLFEIERLGLTNVAEYIKLKDASEKNTDLPTDCDLDSVCAMLENYKILLAKFHQNRQISEQSLSNYFEHFKSEKIVVENSKPVLEDKYKAYLKDKMKLKEDLKQFRKFNINAQLQTEDIDLEKRQKLMLESRFINVMPQYENLRHQILKNIMEFGNNNVEFMMERQYLDRGFFKREKINSNLEKIENFELQIKIEQEKRKKLKQRSFMNEMFVCNSEFLEFHKRKFKDMKKLANNVKLQIELMRKKDQKEIDIEAKERFESLKTQNYDDYVLKLKMAKDQRIIELLEETDNFLREIGAKVVENKGLPEENKIEEGIKVEGAEYDMTQSMMLTHNYNKMYYNFINKNVEVITEQPSLLEGGKLKNYQIVGLQWMISLYNNKVNGILADEMGLGKTIQTIALFCYIMEHKQNFGPFLVVVPLSTLTNWKIEFEKWAPSIKKVIYKGSPQERKEIAAYIKNNKFNVCLTTYEYVLKDKSELNRFHWQYIVVDEGHKMKNPKSQFAMTLGQIYNSEHRILLTGTPLQNNLTELWSLLNFLLPKVFSSCDEFEKWFKMPMKKFGAEKELDLTEEQKLLIVHRFHQVLRPFLLRRIKLEVESELPQKVEYIIKVEMSTWQKIIYDQIAQKESKNILENEVKYNCFMLNKMNNMIMQLRKICNHPYLFQDYYNESEELMRSSGKFELLDRIVPKLIKTGHRMLIFTQMTQVIDLLEVFMRFRSIKYLRLDGSTKHEERGERMAIFNKKNSEFPVFLLSTRAGGLGLNLQTADTVILFDSDWNPQMDLQAQDRVHRIGTLKEVRVLRLVTNGTIEERILSKASYKRSLDEMVIQAGMYNNRSSDQERRQKLEEIIKRQNIQEKRNDEIPNDEEINKLISRNDAEFEFFMELDKLRYEQESRIYPHFDKNINYRLITLDEVPDFIKEERKKPNEADELGKRRKIKIRNIEDLNDDDSLDEEIARIEKDKKRKLRERNLERIKKQEENADEKLEVQAEELIDENDIFIDSDE